MGIRDTLVLFSMIISATVAAPCAEPPEVSRILRRITVEEGQTVSEVQGYFSPVVVRGKVTGDVISIGADITVAGTIDGDAIAVGGGVVLLPQGKVGGDLTSLGGPVRAEGAGRTEADTDSLPYLPLPGQRRPHLTGTLTFISANIVLLLFAALVFRRRRTANLGSAVAGHPWVVVSVGVLFLVVVFFLCEAAGAFKRLELVWLLIVTAITGFTCLAGYLGLSSAIGRLAAARQGWLPGALIGGFLLNALLLVPVAGFALLLAAGVISAGAPIASGFGKSPDWLPSILRRKKNGSDAKKMTS